MGFLVAEEGLEPPTRGLRDRCVQHGNHAPAKLRTQINVCFPAKISPPLHVPIQPKEMRLSLLGRTQTRHVNMAFIDKCPNGN
jgi:hypothetical protein